MRRFALVCVLAACGARTDLGGVKSDAGASGACSSPPPAPAKPCTAWEAGTPQTIAPAESGNTLAGAIASGCGLLVAWHTAGSGSMAWSTRAVDFSGEMLAPPIAHPVLTIQTTTSATLSLATDGSRVGALDDDETGCRFLALDAAGHELEGPVDLGPSRCFGLASSGARWTFVRDDEQGDVSLVSIANGSSSETKLQTAASQMFWDRVVFGDGSFLLYSFFEQPSAQYENWLTPYDASGNLLGEGVLIGGFESAPVVLARAGKAAMAAWSWGTIEALPVDELGHAAGPAQMISNASPIYELSIFSAPSGDVLMTWIVLEPTNDMTLYARALAPDGTPRGPATLLSHDVASDVVRGAVESTGARALLAVTTKDGALEALPLACVQ